MKKKKYSVCKFPSLYGTPITTNYKIIAYIIWFFRDLSSGGVAEIFTDTERIK